MMRNVAMASANRTLSSIGKRLTLLDNRCNVQISNWSALFSEIYRNKDSGANALGGVYSPAHKGDSPFIGRSLFDNDAGVTALSYKQLMDKGRVYDDKSTDSAYLTFPMLPDNFTLRFTWIDDILAADIRPSPTAIDDMDEPARDAELFNVAAANARVGDYWSATSTDPPSKLLSQFKIIADAPNSQIKRLDKVHQATRSMWSPSKRDLLDRIRNELEEVDFAEADVEKYFDIFPHDLNALEGPHNRCCNSIHGNDNDIRRDSCCICGPVFMIRTCMCMVMLLLFRHDTVFFLWERVYV